MLKTDEHMNKITDRIQEQKEADKAAEQARKQRQNRKYGKKVQIAREQEKAAQVSENKKKLGALRKRKKPAEADDFDINVDYQDGDEDRSKGKGKGTARPAGKRGKAVSEKRQVRNEKYGFGGSKRGSKRNDKESTDAGDFDARRNKQPFLGVGKAGGGRGGANGRGQKRPGKGRRQQMRNKPGVRK